MSYTIIIHRDEQEGGFWCECPQLPGCYTQGETVDELMQNMKDAVALYLEEPEGVHSCLAEARKYNRQQAAAFTGLSI